MDLSAGFFIFNYYSANNIKLRGLLTSQMRNLSTLALLFTLLTLSVSAQKLNGSYIETSRNQKLVFNGDGVQFDLWTNFCITSNYVGKGTYQITKGRLFIRPALPHTVPYIIEKISQKNKDSIYFKLTDSLKKPMIGATVWVMRNGHGVAGTSVDINGVGRLSRAKILPTDSVRTGLIGYYTVKLAVGIESDYNLTVFKGMNEEYYYDYLSNHRKGYPIKISENSIKINFKQPGCGNPNAWKEFKKVINEPINLTTSIK